MTDHASTTATTPTRAANQPKATRRQFLSTTAAVGAAAAASALPINRVAWAAGDDVLKVGLVGVGGRGAGAAVQALSAHPNNKLVAVGEAFSDRLEDGLKAIKANAPTIADRVTVDDDHKFVGFDAYKHVVEASDVVLFATSPHFRPQHIEFAVEKGKHIFAEKPVGTDAPSVRRCLESCAKGKAKGLTIVSGLCYRYQRAKQEMMKQVHDGIIGDIISMDCQYWTTGLWHRGSNPAWSEMEYQMRNWLYFTWLSGDHIAEQHIHSLDKCIWANKDQYPLVATATGGRIVRTDSQLYGNIYDHFYVLYEFDNDLKLHSTCRQQDNTATQVMDYITGTKGVANVQRHTIKGHDGKALWRYLAPRGRDAKPDNMYQNEHDDMFAAIRAGKQIYNGDYMCKSTMMAIMGRMAAYTGQRITWDQAWNSQEDLSPAKYEWGPNPVRPVARPGVTAFV